MSENVVEKGTLVPCASLNDLKTARKFCETEYGVTVDEGDCPLELLAYELDDEKFILLDGVLWLLENYKQCGSDEGFCEMTVNDDATIDFVVGYYNGGCGLSEVLEEGNHS